MIEKSTEIGNTEKVAIKTDPLSLENLDNTKSKTDKKLMATKKQYGYPRMRLRNGRPIYYLVWYQNDDKGFRRQKSVYLGTTLPKGYRLGKRVKIASGKLPGKKRD